MIEAGVRFGKDEEAHHIVAEGIAALQEARDILAKLDIGLDEAVTEQNLIHSSIESARCGGRNDTRPERKSSPAP